MHLTGPEATILGASIGSLGYVVLMLKQKPQREVTVQTRDIVVAMKSDIDQLHRDLSAHTMDDAANFRQLRDEIRPPRRRWSLATLGLLVKLFL